MEGGGREGGEKGEKERMEGGKDTPPLEGAWKSLEVDKGAPKATSPAGTSSFFGLPSAWLHLDRPYLFSEAENKK